jgi:hypothetical protein
VRGTAIDVEAVMSDMHGEEAVLAAECPQIATQEGDEQQLSQEEADKELRGNLVDDLLQVQVCATNAPDSSMHTNLTC